MRIGKIVKSNSHIDYVCQVYVYGEVEPCPQPADYALGTFARIALDTAEPAAGALVGIVYNTILVNPDFGALGPRLSQRTDLEVFSPDYLAETATLAGLIAVGWQDRDGRYHQGVPALAAAINGEVERLDDVDVVAFHSDSGGVPRLQYAAALLAIQSPLMPTLLIQTVDRLRSHFPAHQRTLTVLRNNLAWKTVVETAR